MAEYFAGQEPSHWCRTVLCQEKGGALQHRQVLGGNVQESSAAECLAAPHNVRTLRRPFNPLHGMLGR